MKLTPESPELTAYALGQCPAEMYVEIEAILTASPELRAEVEAIRKMAHEVDAALQAEPALQLAPRQRRAILHRRGASPSILDGKTRSTLGEAWAWFAQLRWVSASLVATVGALVATILTVLSVEDAGGRRRTQFLADSSNTLIFGENTRLASAKPSSQSSPTRSLALSSELLSKDDSRSKILSEQEEIAGSFRGAVAPPALPSQPAPLNAPTAEAKESFAFSASQTSREPAVALSSTISNEALGRLTPIYYQEAASSPTWRMRETDRSGYALVRSLVLEGKKPDPAFVHIGDLINYFTEDALPQNWDTNGPAVQATLEVAICPWNASHTLVRILLMAQRTPGGERPTQELALVSALGREPSGNSKSDLLERGYSNFLRHSDVSNRVELIAQGTTLSNRTFETVAKAEDRTALSPGPRSAALVVNGSSEEDSLLVGLRQAYSRSTSRLGEDTARKVVLASDGLGLSKAPPTNEIRALVKSEASKGVPLDVLALGTNPEHIPTLALLAGVGGGQFGKAETPAEVSRFLVESSRPKSQAVAVGVTAALTFDRSQYASWRALGPVVSPPSTSVSPNVLELAPKDTALWKLAENPIHEGSQYALLVELAPPDSAFGDTARSLSPSPSHRILLRMAMTPLAAKTSAPTQFEVFFDGEPTPFHKASTDFKFSAAVAGFGLLLRGAEDRGTLTWPLVEQMAIEGRGSDLDGSRAEFLELARKAKDLQ